MIYGFVDFENTETASKEINEEIEYIKKRLSFSYGKIYV